MQLAIKRPREMGHYIGLTAVSGFLILGLAFSTGRALADPEEAWSVSFGGGDDDAAYAVAQAADGGYVLAGETRSAASPR